MNPFEHRSVLRFAFVRRSKTATAAQNKRCRKGEKENNVEAKLRLPTNQRFQDLYNTIEAFSYLGRARTQRSAVTGWIGQPSVSYLTEMPSNSFSWYRSMDRGRSTRSPRPHIPIGLQQTRPSSPFSRPVRTKIQTTVYESDVTYLRVGGSKARLPTSRTGVVESALLLNRVRKVDTWQVRHFRDLFDSRLSLKKIEKGK